MIGGRLADVRGRRIVGAIALAGGVGLTVAMFASQGWCAVGLLDRRRPSSGPPPSPPSASTAPSCSPPRPGGGPTASSPSSASSGSAVGLLIVGTLSDREGGIGAAMPYVAIGPALLAVLILVAYPETAHQELEDLNPEDRRSPA